MFKIEVLDEACSDSMIDGVHKKLSFTIDLSAFYWLLAPDNWSEGTSALISNAFQFSLVQYNTKVSCLPINYILCYFITFMPNLYSG